MFMTFDLIFTMKDSHIVKVLNFRSSESEEKNDFACEVRSSQEADIVWRFGGQSRRQALTPLSKSERAQQPSFCPPLLHRQMLSTAPSRGRSRLCTTSVHLD